MTFRTIQRAAVTGLALFTLASCGGIGSGDSGLFKKTGASSDEAIARQRENTPLAENEDRGTIWDLFSGNDNPNTTVEVNKYLWQASLEVLNFLPIETVDPFSGVIVTGYGTPPGGGRAYRATILVQDPALDARSLKLSMSTRSGPVATETVRTIEDAILTRARQLRIRDGNL